ncbi:xanthine dehydrogenase family protein molybdopterin-binding subunit [candidate division KSB1 bacterium]|nr:xanthine dehydrogenase family protein molybdopterin-binding subunit [candidate division KSB1 bacterium]
MNETNNLTRRDFIKVVSAAGSGLVLGFYLPAKGEELRALGEPAFSPNAWLNIDTKGLTTITVARSEMGQGARTALPMIVAEELEADWEKIRLEFALAHPDKYGDMTTGGSTSVRRSWEMLRKAGATAREMLITAASQAWNVDRTTCRAENGAVIHVPSKRRRTYGQLAEQAAKLPAPTDVPLKDSKDFRLLGKSLPRLDSREKIAGRARFGIDTKIPGMLVATIERCPVFGGKLKSFDATKALAIKGVQRVLEVPNGVAVVANSTWAALQGRAALTVSWDEGPHAELSSASIHKMFEEKSKQDGKVMRQEGEVAAALAAAAQKIEAVYEVPFLAHAPMEPMNCIAEVRSDSAEIWAPTQSPQGAQREVAQVTGLPLEKIKVHTTLLGGGFGRRLLSDFVAEAAQLSKVMGAPVQIFWTREDDMQHGFHRPASYHRMSAALDKDAQLSAWQHHLVAPSISAQLFGGGENNPRPDAVDGAAQLPYRIPNLLVDYVMANTAVPIGWWRSVYNTQNAFVNECFLDEIAAAAKVDPFQLRLQLLPEGSRLRGVLELVADKAEWNKPPATGRGRGIACHACFGSYVAEIAEVSIDQTNHVRVHKVVCAVDCGPIVNPDIIAAQFEGAVVMALSATLKSAITIAHGRVEQGNFDDFPLLTFDEMPDVEVHILPSTASQGGIGEPGVPPVVPAVCNAIFAATGKRIRRLPIRSEDLRGT